MRKWFLASLLGVVALAAHTSANPSKTFGLGFGNVRCTRYADDAMMRGDIGAPSEADFFDVIHYCLELDFDIIDSIISGTSSVQVQSTMDGLTGITLDLVELTVDLVTMEGDTLDFVHKYGKLSIVFGAALAQNDTVRIDITYHGTPANDGSGGFFFDPKVTYSIGVGEDAQDPSMGKYWFPCHDVPHDKATFEILATVPEGYQVASNGKLVEVILLDSTATYHWVENHPIATYLIMVAISDYATFSHWHYSGPDDSVEIVYFVFPEDSATAAEKFQCVPDMVSFFSTAFIPYPFDKYGMAETFLGDAMEHQTCVSLGRSVITGPTSIDKLLAHELAHQWWGDLVTLGDWRDIWLNEGMATYCEALYAEYMGGDIAYRGYMDTLAIFYFNSEPFEGRFPIYDPEVLWGATVYWKGAWVVHMLRYIVGDEDFWASLQRYAHTHSYGNATTMDLKVAFEAETGEDLEWFFEQWIYKQGYPEYQVEWIDSGPLWVVEVHVSQIQENAPIFIMPVEVTLVTAEGEMTDTVLIDQEDQIFTLYPDAEPLALLFDPRGCILKKDYYLNTPLDVQRPQIPQTFSLSQNYPNPFNPTTEIRYTLPVTCLAKLEIFNILGQRVCTLMNEHQTAGHKAIIWDGRDDGGEKIPGGIYFYRLRAGNYTRTKRMVLLR